MDGGEVVSKDRPDQPAKLFEQHQRNGVITAGTKKKARKKRKNRTQYTGIKIQSENTLKPKRWKEKEVILD